MLLDDLDNDDDDEEVVFDEEPKPKKLKKSKSKDTQTIFASAEEFASLLDDEGSSKIAPGSSNALSNKDNASKFDNAREFVYYVYQTCSLKVQNSLIGNKNETGGWKDLTKRLVKIKVIKVETLGKNGRVKISLRKKQKREDINQFDVA